MKRTLTISVIWMALLLHVGILILRSPQEENSEILFGGSDDEDIEIFQDIRFYLTENKNPRFQFESSRLELIAGIRGIFTGPKGKVYDEKGNILEFRSQNGEYLESNNSLSFFGDVNLHFQDFHLSCESGFYDMNQQLFNGEGNVSSIGIAKKTEDQMNVKSHKVFSYPVKKWARFEGDVKGEILRKRRYQGQFDFEAQEIEVDFFSSRVNLTDEVKIKRENMILTAQKSSIFLENYTKKLKYYELSDDVVIKQKIRERLSGRVINRVAYSEKLEGFIQDKKIILTGSPRVLSNDDVIRGSKIVLRENANIVEVIDSTSSINYRK